MSQAHPNFKLSLRTDVRNPDHHLWNNHGTWWCHFTAHTADGTKHRVRRSLRTRNMSQARRRRDTLLDGLAAALGRGTPCLQTINPRLS